MILKTIFMSLYWFNWIKTIKLYLKILKHLQINFFCKYFLFSYLSIINNSKINEILLTNTNFNIYSNFILVLDIFNLIVFHIIIFILSNNISYKFFNYNNIYYLISPWNIFLIIYRLIIVCFIFLLLIIISISIISIILIRALLLYLNNFVITNQR